MRARRYFVRTVPMVLVVLCLIVFPSCSTSSGLTATAGGGLVVQAIPSPTPTALPALTVVSSPTPTATAIHATEISTPTATAPAKDGVIWTGTITSDTSRQYMINGGAVNVCKTNWLIDLDFVVSSTGEVRGDGKATMMEPRTCTAAAEMAPNVTGYVITVAGLKDNITVQPASRRHPVTSGKARASLEGSIELFVTAQV